MASRFDRRVIPESIIEPSKVVPEVYCTATITLKSGAIYDGRIVSEDTSGPALAVGLAINPVESDQRRHIAKTEIASQRVSETSPVPASLVNTLTRDEIFDLLAWIETGGSTNQPISGP